MVPVLALTVPILVSAVVVFLASFVVHTVLTYHAGDYRKLPSQDEVQDALRRFDIPPGDYMLPRPDSMKDMGSPEFKAKRDKGPVLLATVIKGPFTMGPALLQWFIYCVVVEVFAAYLAGRAHGAGTPYLAVFRTAGTVAFCGFALAQWQETIWHHRAVGTTIRNTFDGLVYALLSAGVFGWLWPH